jgi:hypothetical protein
MANFMLSSVEEAKEGENLGDLYVARRTILNIYSINKQVEVLEGESFDSGECSAL